MKRNPEQDVVDEIDRLVDEQLEAAHRYRGWPDDYEPRCPVCRLKWHGLTGDGVFGGAGCPGEYGTDEQIAEWKQRQKGLAFNMLSASEVAWLYGVDEGTLYMAPEPGPITPVNLDEDGWVDMGYIDETGIQ